MELQLIEVMRMRMKMHLIQFVLIVNLIQRKLMKVITNWENRMNKEFHHWAGFDDSWRQFEITQSPVPSHLATPS
jgi:tRNA 2-selenouridine synthase SelU